jgi:hypothetical protein
VGGFEGRVISQGNSVEGRLSMLSNSSGAMFGDFISQSCCAENHGKDVDETVFVRRHKYQQVSLSGGGNYEVTNCRKVVGSVGCLHRAMPVMRLR